MVSYFLCCSRIIPIIFCDFSSIWMVGSTHVETKVDVISWYEELYSFSLNFNLVRAFCIFTLLFCVIKELPKGSGGYFPLFLFSINGNNWNMFYVGGWYTTMNATLIIHVSPIIHISGREILCCSMITILLTFVLRIRLLIWYLFCSRIIIGGTWWITRIPITFCKISL